MKSFEIKFLLYIILKSNKSNSFEWFDQAIPNQSEESTEICQGIFNLPGLPLNFPYSQICCPIDTGSKQEGKELAKCLPSFIIAGCQKSGTTALTALLDEHPNISMAKKKEIHFFDKPKETIKNKSLKNYIEYFSPLMINNDEPTTPTFITGEATPFYIASEDACESMNHFMPHIKLIVLVRNPVDRAVSEYKMKERRIQDQRYLIEILSSEYGAKSARLCFQNMTSSFHISAPNFQRTLDLKKRNINLINCLIKEIGPNGKWEQFTIPLLQVIAKRERSAKDRGLDPLKARFEVIDKCFPVQVNFNEFPFGFNKDCYIRKENVNEFNTAMEGEMTNLNHCLAGPLIEFDKSRNSKLVLKTMDKIINDCTGKINKGISKQFLYRGLYAIQLYKCYKYIPKDRILIIHSDDLKAKPDDVLNIVQNFIGVPIYNFTLSLKTDENHIENLISEKFPDFKNKTGWRFISDPVEIPIDIKKRLYDFYEPHNKLFFDTIAHELPGWILK